MIKKYYSIINQYRNLKDSCPDKWIQNCKSQNNLRDAITVAAFAIDNDNNRHTHQHRLKERELQQFADNLYQKSQCIQNSKTFDELYNIVSSCKITGIGSLTIYDTSNRIGEFLNLRPTHIYLHPGTRTDIEHFLGKMKRTYIDKEELPEPFKSSDLCPAELEELFSIFKYQLKNNKG